MAIIKLTPEPDSDLDTVFQLAASAGIEGQARLEVVEAWDMIQRWHQWIEERYGTLIELRHLSDGDDPPDLQFVFPEIVVPFEHTWLLPYPLGWAEDIKHTMFPDACTNVPSLSNPPANRDELLAIMGSLEGTWSDVKDEWITLVRALVAAVRKKMLRLPAGGIIGIVNRASYDRHNIRFLAKLAGDFINSDRCHDFAPYTLILLTRLNHRQFHSALITRGCGVLECSSY
jgi:hypothetical protein